MLKINNCEEYYCEVRSVAYAADLGDEFDKIEKELGESEYIYELFKSDKPLSFGGRILNSKGDFIQTCSVEFTPAEKVMGKYTSPCWKVIVGGENRNGAN